MAKPETPSALQALGPVRPTSRAVPADDDVVVCNSVKVPPATPAGRGVTADA